MMQLILNKFHLKNCLSEFLGSHSEKRFKTLEMSLCHGFLVLVFETDKYLHQHKKQ